MLPDNDLTKRNKQTTEGSPSSGGQTKKLLWSRVRDGISIPGAQSADIAEPQVQVVDKDPGSQSMNWARAYGRYLVAAGLIAGLAFPEIASTFRPYLTELLIGSLVLALLQINYSDVVAMERKRGIVLGLSLALLTLAPAFVALQVKAVLVPYGLPTTIADGMILAAMAPPLLSAPVIALLLGLNTVLALVIALMGHVFAPITIAYLAEFFVGSHISISVDELATRLALLIGSGFAIGLMLHLLRFPKLISNGGKFNTLLDGFSVLTLALVAAALMDGVTALALTDIKFVVLAFLCGCVLNVVLQIFGAAMFSGLGVKTALTAGLLFGYRNTGILIVVLAGTTDPKLLTFLAIVQISSFLMPMFSSAVVRRIKVIGLRPA